MFDGIIWTLNNVRFILGMCKNLISLGTLVEKGYKFNVERNVLCVMASDKVILRGRHHRNLYVLEGSTICGEAHVIASQEEMALLWHRRLGHMSKKGMEVLRKQDLLSGLKSSKLDFCEHYVFGKHKRSAFGIGIHRSIEVLEYAHSDVWDKSPVPLHSGKEYYISFNDDYSRYVWVYFLHHKSEVFATFIKWKAQDLDWKEGLPPEFWAEVVNTAAYLVNLSPCSAVQLKTPFELWHKWVPDYSRLRVFGCIAYAHTPRENRTKLDPKAKKCYFLGYQQGVKGYRLWDPVDCKLIVNRDVSFNEASDNKTWELVELPKSKQVITCRWVYKRKEGSGTGEKIFKAKLVAKGFTQRKGVDYSKVFAPIAKYLTIRLLLSLVCMFGLVLDQMDVVTTFLYGVLDEEIFMRQPPSFARKGQESLVCRFLKSLYGLKQSPRQWNKRFDEFMKSQGFTRSVEDPCVYLKQVSNEVFGLIILVLYVDDMLIAAKDKSEVEKVKTQLSTEFSMKDFGRVKRILGMEIHRDVKGGRLWLTQRNYARKVLERFNMLDAKPVGTPLANHFKHQLSAKFCPLDATEKGLMSKIPYESAVGSLMYLMVCTRQDIAYALGKVSKYNANPRKVHWEAVKWILRYIKGTMGYGLLFDAHSHQARTLVGFVDSNYA
ncbi:hypothetical protein R1flu_001998 [Riccia fluitans]|uniref:Retrovirus-related Pol polyprotein from transposon TNT 1-94 n=1 Tax=Riccia fluitans TaxID=41844 RepID=A0ABD1Y4V4_9MARC